MVSAAMLVAMPIYCLQTLKELGLMREPGMPVYTFSAQAPPFILQRKPGKVLFGIPRGCTPRAGASLYPPSSPPTPPDPRAVRGSLVGRDTDTHARAYLRPLRRAQGSGIHGDGDIPLGRSYSLRTQGPSLSAWSAKGRPCQTELPKSTTHMHCIKQSFQGLLFPKAKLRAPRRAIPTEEATSKELPVGLTGSQPALAQTAFQVSLLPCTPYLRRTIIHHVTQTQPSSSSYCCSTHKHTCNCPCNCPSHKHTCAHPDCLNNWVDLALGGPKP
eukprot:1142539-Pelagomonas_calceolata.AAC.1